jgi:hypothetical protein
METTSNEGVDLESEGQVQLIFISAILFKSCFIYKILILKILVISDDIHHNKLKKAAIDKEMV